MGEQRVEASTQGEERSAGDGERRLMERAVSAYAAHVRAIARFQKAVTEFRRVKQEHDVLHAMLADLAAERQQTAARRQAVHAAVRDYVHALRADERTPEVALSMTKRTLRTIVLHLPLAESLPNPEPLLEDAVRWAIEAYYDAA